MVLQRGGKGPIVWGFTPAGTKVVITFAGQQYTALADATGVWRVQLAPMVAGGPYTLSATTASGTVTLSDILIGDVYLYVPSSEALVASIFAVVCVH